MDPFTEQLVRSRAELMRMARARLYNPHWAEDAVSETLLAALEHPPDFDEPARVRAWLRGILQHKLVDQLRRQLADDPLDGIEDRADPSRGVDPVQRLGDVQFLDALTRQLEQLPVVQARAFVMREGLGIESREICRDLGISAGNLWVMLHRARRRLRAGLVAFAV